MKAIRLSTLAARTIPIILVLGLGILIVAMAAQSAVRANTPSAFDAAADFSPTANPSGVWSYGFIPVGGSFTDLVLYDHPWNYEGLDEWNHSVVQQGYAPSTAHNGTGSPITVLGTITYGPGQLSLHPGAEGQHGVCRFTAPFDGTFQIDVTFSVGDLANTTTDVHVAKNGVSLFDGDVDGNVSPSDSEHFSQVQTLTAGDIIDFTVGLGDDDFAGDTTMLDATISGDETPTPPATPTPSPTPSPITPSPTSTPGPPSVGGIVEFQRGPSAPSAQQPDSAASPYAALAGGAAAAALALAAGAWYTRRRWIR